jgi:putative ABC transport system permease protein
MTGASFVLRGLWFFRKSYLGVLAGSALGAMILLGALMAGDSVKETLRHVAEVRLGKVDVVLTGGDRFFRSALADDMADVEAAPILFLKATATVRASGRSMGRVQVLGVDQRFWKLGPGDRGGATPQGREFFVNDYLARTLDCGVDGTLVLRFEKPALIARDAPLAGKTSELVVLSGRVGEICGDEQFGRFSLETTQLPQATVFVPIERLQQAIGFVGKANLMLMRNRKNLGNDELLSLVRRRCTLEDYGLSVTEVPLAGANEVRTSRIFLDRQVAEAIRESFPAAQPVITYMANTIAANGRETPYSMVTALAPEAAAFLPKDFHGVVLNAWEAEDLGAGVGDEVRIVYYALEGQNRLVERSAKFPVVGVVPLTGLAADRMWMPDFPGVASAENTAEWDAGVPIDTKRIRDKDETYWDDYRGTPKLFLPLEKGRELFGNRWGEFTALRVPVALGSRDEIARKLLDGMTPALAGLVVQDIRGAGMAAATASVDFAGLFLGMSLFLMAAAVALTAMLFRFHIEQRNRESGLLDALGIPAKKILRWRMTEGLCLVLVGSVAGACLAAGYTRFLLGFLETIWSQGDGPRLFRFHVEPATLLTGVVVFSGLMMLVIWLVTRKQARRTVSLRLEAGTEEVARPPASRVPWLAAGFAACGLAALAGSGLLGPQGAFFLAGLALLLSGLAAYRWVLRRRVSAGGGLSSRRMADLNCGRRETRSLVMVGTVACGVFLVVAVAAFRKHENDNWRERDSGAGGFAFWVETTTAAERVDGAAEDDTAGLGEARKSFGEILPLRIGAGDDASCFNLNSVARPRLLATDSAALATLGAFPIKDVVDGIEKSWDSLREGSVMRAFVDETTLLWVLKKKLGDRIIYQDEWGRDFAVEIAGTLDGTVFQGSLVVDEARFLEHYPSAEGPRIFLIESGTDLEPARAILQRTLSESGARVESSRERLAAFHGVENTYISIFQVLGGLGVIVGSAGLGLVTARNLMDRRHEFAILRTIGIPLAVTRRVVLLETAQCIRWGIAIGVVAALVSILPSLQAAGIGTSIVWIILLVLLIAANAAFWSWLAFVWQNRKMLTAQQDFS